MAKKGGDMSDMSLSWSNWRTTRFAKGDVLFMQDVAPESAYAIKSGIVRSYTLTPSGEERSISFIVAPELLPVCWLFSKTDTTMFYYVAHTDCEAYVINKPEFHEHVLHTSGVAYTLLAHMVNDYVAKSLQIAALEQTRARGKLLHTLNSFCVRYGNKLTDDLVRIPIPLTQSDIASFAGLTRETTLLELTELRKDRVITVKNKLYTINVVSLRSLMEDEQSASIKITD